MVSLRNGLGDADYRDIAVVANKLDLLNIGDEISFTPDMFSTEQLYDTVIESFNVLDARLSLSCGVNRWYASKNGNVFKCDFRKDIIIVRRTK